MTSRQDTYGAGIETLEEVSKIVDSLYAKVGELLKSFVAFVDSWRGTVGKNSIAYTAPVSVLFYFSPHECSAWRCSTRQTFARRCLTIPQHDFREL